MVSNGLDISSPTHVFFDLSTQCSRMNIFGSLFARVCGVTLSARAEGRGRALCFRLVLFISAPQTPFVVAVRKLRVCVKAVLTDRPTFIDRIVNNGAMLDGEC